LNKSNPSQDVDPPVTTSQIVTVVNPPSTSNALITTDPPKNQRIPRDDKAMDEPDIDIMNIDQTRCSVFDCSNNSILGKKYCKDHEGEEDVSDSESTDEAHRYCVECLEKGQKNRALPSKNICAACDSENTDPDLCESCYNEDKYVPALPGSNLCAICMKNKFGPLLTAPQKQLTLTNGKSGNVSDRVPTEDNGCCEACFKNGVQLEKIGGESLCEQCIERKKTRRQYRPQQSNATAN